MSAARIAQLDEYVGLPQGHPESYRSVVLREVVEPLGLDPASFMGPRRQRGGRPGGVRGVMTRPWRPRAGWIFNCSGSARTAT
ncbi:hypothetical protein TPA0910_00060 [Streptomyces hygroscopicus subsp. sporocinereus]|uniref:Uncharacterized protein n=1 Tax=Streptomyces hygroscopicus TaxID=1912 RepID=A0ABQ3TQP5_STRHY|nr:hypothetical protein TPA0910_00060 [Streptomyces hygroscopicus]